MSTWQQAYLKQAQADFQMYLELRIHKNHLCHQLHFLQMACEKLGKAYIMPPDQEPEMSHKTFERLVQYLKNSPELKRYLGYDGKNEQYRSLLNSLLPLATQIENLVPHGISSPNTECPWIENQSIQSPLNYRFSQLVNDLRLAKLTEIIKKLLEFERV